MPKREYRDNGVTIRVKHASFVDLPQAANFQSRIFSGCLPLHFVHLFKQRAFVAGLSLSRRDRRRNIRDSWGATAQTSLDRSDQNLQKTGGVIKYTDRIVHLNLVLNFYK